MHHMPLPSNRQHLNSGACLKDKREDNQKSFMLCTTVVYVCLCVGTITSELE